MRDLRYLRSGRDDWKSRRRSVFTSGEIAATDDEEPLWIEEGNNATIGDFIGKINENDVSVYLVLGTGGHVTHLSIFF